MSDKALSSPEGARCEMMSLARLVNWNTSSHRVTNMPTAYCTIQYIYILHWIMFTVGVFCTVSSLFTYDFKYKINQNNLKNELVKTKAEILTRLKNCNKYKQRKFY